MAEDKKVVYTTRVKGFWNSRHELFQDGERVGLLTLERNWHGMVTSGSYRPEKGEVLLFRRDPGLLRSQFSMWTDGKEWLASSLRWSPLAREVTLTTGGKPYVLRPTPSLGRGWVLEAPKTGVTARVHPGLVGRASRIEVYRRIDFPLLVFAYFLGAQIHLESWLPGRKVAEFPA